MASEISCLAFVPEDRMTLFKSIAENGAPMFSGVLAGPDGKPMIILISRFRGHAVIVDRDGLVLAHPKQSWRQEMKDLSGVLPVREMKAGKTWVAEFYSPVLNIDTITGYTTVKGSG